MTIGYEASRRVEFRDTDAAGIAHFSMFFVWMEQAEHEALRHLGMSVVQRHGARTVSWPRVSAHCDYKSPARFEDELRIHVTIVKLGTKSVTYQFDFYRDQRHLARGQLTTVCCRLGDDGRWSSIEIPPELETRLRPLVASPAD